MPRAQGAQERWTYKDVLCDRHGCLSVVETCDRQGWRKVEQRPLLHFPVLRGTWMSMSGAGAVAEMVENDPRAQGCVRAMKATIFG